MWFVPRFGFVGPRRSGSESSIFERSSGFQALAPLVLVDGLNLDEPGAGLEREERVIWVSERL